MAYNQGVTIGVDYVALTSKISPTLLAVVRKCLLLIIFRCVMTLLQKYYSTLFEKNTTPLLIPGGVLSPGTDGGVPPSRLPPDPLIPDFFRGQPRLYRIY